MFEVNKIKTAKFQFTFSKTKRKIIRILTNQKKFPRNLQSASLRNLSLLFHTHTISTFSVNKQTPYVLFILVFLTFQIKVSYFFLKKFKEKNFLMSF